MVSRRKDAHARECNHKIFELMARYRVKIGSSDLGLSVQIMNVGWDSILEWKRDGESRNYLQEPSGNFTISCKNLPEAWGVPAEVFQDLIDDEGNCSEFSVSVEVFCGGSWVEKWAGNFTSNDWKSNRDQKILIVRVKQDSAAACLKRNWKRTENPFSLDSYEVRPSVNSLKTYEYSNYVSNAGGGGSCSAPVTIPGYCYNQLIQTNGPGYIICTYQYHRYELAGSCSGPLAVEPDVTVDDPWQLVTNACPVSSLWWTCPPNGDAIFKYRNGRLLSEVIEYLFEQTGCGLTVVSNLLAINPDDTQPSNAVYDTHAINYQTMVIFQKSDVKRPDATNLSSSPAWDIKLSDLLEDLQTLFNAQWRIDGTTFRIEHVSYFDEQPGNDYTGAKYVKELEADKSDTPQFIRFKYRDEKTGPYFKGQPIEIYCGDGEKDLTLRLFSTDIQYMQTTDGREAIGDDGFVLMACFTDGPNLKVINNNVPLSWPKLHEYFYPYNMPGAGEINGAPVTPISLKKTRKQPSFIVHHCCDDTFDPAELQTTAIGDGVVEGAAWNIAQDYIELELKY